MLHRVGSKPTMTAGKVKEEDKSKTPNGANAAKKKGPIDWAQKRASKLILAPQPRLTEFKAVYSNGMDADVADDNRQVQISSSSLSDLIPNIIQRHLIENTEEVSQTPFIATIQASCLFLDISRFTSLSELLAMEHGMRGPEVLARSVNRLFTQLVRLVQRAGGDIFKFAGDAVIVLWPASPESSDEGETLAVAAHRAVQCAYDVQSTVEELKLDEFKSDKNKKMDLSLAFKCGVGVGTVSIVHLGGGKLAFGGFAGEYEEGRTSTKRVLDPRTQTATSTGAAIAGRREYIALGDPLKQAFAAEKQAQRHDIVVSRQAWSLVSEHYSEKKRNNQPLTDGFVLIDKQKSNIKKKRQQDTALPQKEWMLTYVPRSAHLFLEVEAHTRKDWVSELRRVTVLFINLGVPKDKLQAMLTRHEGIDLLHEYFVRVQTAVMDYEGSINKFLMDDKGSTVIAVFGLPPISHENDATRGVLASLAISTFLQEMGAEPAVGIATGIAFCGVVGHPGGRREYTVLGDIVNLSARLMQRAGEKQEGVLCDRETYYQAQEHLEFNFLKPIQVKGKAKKVDVWQPHQKAIKAKRNLLMKALGIRKHRRRRSLDGDWREQVSQYGQRDGITLSIKEVAELKELMNEARSNKSRDVPAISVSSNARSLFDRPKSSVKKNIPTGDHHEDERVLTSDQYDELMQVMTDMYDAVMGEVICPVVLEGSIGMGKSRILSRLSSVLKSEKDIWVLEAACNPFERGTLARPFGLFITLLSIAIWLAYNEETKKKASMDSSASLEDIPVAFRRMILMRWLASSPSWSTDTTTKYLLNEDFGVDFEEPLEEQNRKALFDEERSYRLSSPRSLPQDSEEADRNRLLIQQKAEIICALFEGMCTDRKVICLIDDCLYLDSSSWSVALFLAKHSSSFGKGLGMVISSRPVADFVLIDANSRDSYMNFRRLPGVRKLSCPPLPPRMVRQVAQELMRVDAIGPDIEIALEKAQGNPLFVREMCQSMMDQPDVLDFDLKNKVVTFGKAAQMKLKNKNEFPSCQSCNKRFPRARDKQHCKMCGRVVCTDCCPQGNKRMVLGYKEPVRCCLECSEDPGRARRVTVEAIEEMKLEPPVAIVCVIGTWIDKLTTKQQMVLKVACLLRQEMRFEKTKAFEAYPLDRAGASFELEFDALVQLGFVRPVIDEDRDGPKGIFSAQDEDVYEFCHTFLPDVLNQRVLESQREELQNQINEARLKREEQDRIEFMQAKGRGLAQLRLKEGYLMVHKFNVNSNRKAWKQRWAVIVGHRLEFYYDRNQKSCTAACDLKQAKISVEKSDLSGRKRVIRIMVQSWEKGGVQIAKPRDFFISPELSTDQERDQWVYFLQMAIESNAYENGRGKRGTSVTGWFRAKVPKAQLQIKRPGGLAASTPTLSDFQTNSSDSSTPRKSRGLELILGKKKSSAATSASGEPVVAAYQSPEVINE